MIIFFLVRIALVMMIFRIYLSARLDPTELKKDRDTDYALSYKPKGLLNLSHYILLCCTV